MSKAATMRKLLVFSAASSFLAGNVLARERAPDNLGVGRATAGPADDRHEESFLEWRCRDL
jgi:hypothetical protein